MTDDMHPLARNPARQRRQRGQVSSPGVDVGGALRALREARQLSIRGLAEQSGLAANTLSLIENGKTSPSVSTLQQLAHTLAVPITAFFEQDTPIGNIQLTRAGERPRAIFDHGSLEDLGSGLGDCPVEPFLVTLAPGASSGDGAVVHAGHEFVLCLSAQITYTIQQQLYVLHPGDSLLFEAHLPHHWQNHTDTEAQMLIMFCIKHDQQRPTRLHFTGNATP